MSIKKKYIFAAIIMLVLAPSFIFLPDQVNDRIDWGKKAKKNMYAIAIRGTFSEKEGAVIMKEFDELSAPDIKKDSGGNVISITRYRESAKFYSDIWSRLTWVRLEIKNNKNYNFGEICNIVKTVSDKWKSISDIKVIDDDGNEYCVSD